MKKKALFLLVIQQIISENMCSVLLGEKMKYEELADFASSCKYDKKIIEEYINNFKSVKELSFLDGLEDNRLIMKLSSKEKESLDKGFQILKEKEPDINISYEEFQSNKIVVNGQTRKLFKYIHHQKLSEQIGKYKLPDKELYIVVSNNFNDMVLASTENSSKALMSSSSAAVSSSSAKLSSSSKAQSRSSILSSSSAAVSSSSDASSSSRAAVSSSSVVPGSSESIAASADSAAAPPAASSSSQSASSSSVASSSSAPVVSSSSVSRRDILGPVKVSKVYGIDEMKGRYKSPRRALFMSLIIPGSGQLYVGGSKFNYARGGAYLAIEGALWGGWYYYSVHKYNRQVSRYRNFAKAHYNAVTYETKV